MREDDKGVTELDVGNFDVGEAFYRFFMRDAGRAFSESVENTGGAFRSEFLEGASAGKHENNDGRDEILMEQNAGDDRDGGEKIGAELAVEEPDSEAKKQGQATCKQGKKQGDIGKRAEFEGGETEKQMNRDPCGRQDGDDSGAVPDSPARKRRNAELSTLSAARLAGARAVGLCLGAAPLEISRVPALSSVAFVDWVFALTLTSTYDHQEQYKGTPIGGMRSASLR